MSNLYIHRYSQNETTDYIIKTNLHPDFHIPDINENLNVKRKTMTNKDLHGAMDNVL